MFFDGTSYCFCGVFYVAYDDDDNNDDHGEDCGEG